MSHSSAAASAGGKEGLTDADIDKIAGRVAQMIRLGTGTSPASAPPESAPNLQGLAGQDQSAAPSHEAGWSVVDDPWTEQDPWREEWRAKDARAEDDKLTPPSMRASDTWKEWRDGSEQRQSWDQDDGWKSRPGRQHAWDQDNSWQSWSSQGSSWQHDRGWWQGQWTQPKPAPSWPGWERFRLWKQYVKRWKDSLHLSEVQAADRLLEILPWEIKTTLEDIPDSELTVEIILRRMGFKSGEREDDDLYRTGSEAMQDTERKKDEDLHAFAERRRRQFDKAKSIGMEIPQKIQGMLLMQGARLNEQGRQNLKSLTKGSMLGEDILWALPKLDTGGKIWSDGKQSSLLSMGSEEAPPPSEPHRAESGPVEEPIYEWSYWADELDSEDEAMVLVELSEKSLAEPEAWKENQQLKTALKRDRGFWKKKRRLTPSQLKLITKCGNCGEVGHWHKECKNPHRPRERDGKGKPRSGGAEIEAFTFAAIGASDDQDFNLDGITVLGREVLATLREIISSETTELSLLILEGGLIIVDSGASQAIIGRRALKELEGDLQRRGLRINWIEKSVQTPRGIGGSATLVGVAVVPISIGGKSGTVEFVVTEEDLPPLLPGGFLEQFGAVLDYEKDLLLLKKLDCETEPHRIGKNHRGIYINDWRGTESSFSPSSRALPAGLGSDAFRAPTEKKDVLSWKDPSRRNYRAHREIRLKSMRSRPDSDISERVKIQWIRLLHAGLMWIQTLMDKFFALNRRGRLFPGRELRRRMMEDPRLVNDLYEYRVPMSAPLADGTVPWTLCVHRPRWFVTSYNQHGSWEQCSKCKVRTSYREIGYRGDGHRQMTASEMRKLRQQLPRDVRPLSSAGSASQEGTAQAPSRRAASAPNDENTWSSFNQEPPPPWASEMVRGLSAAVAEAMTASTGPMAAALREQSVTLSHMVATMQQMAPEPPAASGSADSSTPASPTGPPPTTTGASPNLGFTMVEEAPADTD
ncbi:unnamed protein product, partial [Prorocentrum cordatum]